MGWGAGRAAGLAMAAGLAAARAAGLAMMAGLADWPDHTACPAAAGFAMGCRLDRNAWKNPSARFAMENPAARQAMGSPAVLPAWRRWPDPSASKNPTAPAGLAAMWGWGRSAACLKAVAYRRYGCS